MAAARATALCTFGGLGGLVRQVSRVGVGCQDCQLPRRGGPFLVKVAFPVTIDIVRGSRPGRHRHTHDEVSTEKSE
ncbi:hypothetical protein AQJ58_04185 [Streptomyces sp. DSM 15324]|nr:hypothetical protein AQJ58_04185 [Streptomyces sp. DSM 15324]